MQKMSPETTSLNYCPKKLERVYDEIKTCTECVLGGQENYALPRGNINSTMIILGEAAGEVEAECHQVFTGPAGILMDRVWEAAGLATSDFYITNIVKCRPVAKSDPGKQNFTPKVEQRERCKSFLDAEMELIDPKLIVTVGRTATETIIGKISSMGSTRGKPYIIEGSLHPYSKIFIFPMLHPAYILHSKRDPQQYMQARTIMWEDIQTLAKLIKEEKLNVR